MNTRLCNASLNITTDHRGRVESKIVLSYVTQNGNKLIRHKRVIGEDDLNCCFDAAYGGTAEVTKDMRKNLSMFLVNICDMYYI